MTKNKLQFLMCTLFSAVSRCNSVDDGERDWAGSHFCCPRVPEAASLHNHVDFRANHPFILSIRGIETNSILFMGRIVELGRRVSLSYSGTLNR